MINVWDRPGTIAALQKLWAEGVPCLAISRAISDDVGFKVSRNAVIGKAHRLGLHLTFPRRQGVPSTSKQTKTGRKKSGPRPANQAPFINARRPGTDWVPDDGSAARRREARLSGMALVQRVESGAGVVSPNARPFAQSSGCKWVLTGGMVCCNPSGRKTYCAGHSAVAYDKTPASNEEKTAKAAEALTRFDGVIDLNKKAPVIDKTGWDGARLAA